MTQSTPEQIEAEIEVQRAQLADTVDQLTQKLDVKAQAKARISSIPPMTYAAFACAAILVGGLVGWRGRR
jgi:F0F1-type ATP synthase assembly protein I